MRKKRKLKTAADNSRLLNPTWLPPPKHTPIFCSIFFKRGWVPGVTALCSFPPPLLRINSRFLFKRLLRLAVLQINTSTPTPPSHASLCLSSSSCCFSHQAGGSFQVFEQCSVACRVAVLSHVRQKQSASRRGMKGNGAVQPLLFTMGNILS